MEGIFQLKFDKIKNWILPYNFEKNKNQKIRIFFDLLEGISYPEI